MSAPPPTVVGRLFLFLAIAYRAMHALLGAAPAKAQPVSLSGQARAIDSQGRALLKKLQRMPVGADGARQPSLPLLARRLGMSLGALRQALQALEAAGFLRLERTDPARSETRRIFLTSDREVA